MARDRRESDRQTTGPGRAFARLERHWRTATAPQGLAASALADADLWGLSLAGLPGLLDATTRWLVLLERDGVDAALDALPCMPQHAATGRT